MEAEAANRTKDVFLATLSHEVRTPLNAIFGWAGILRSKRCTDEELQEGMEVIERNCKIQAQLIEEMMDISRVMSGKLELDVRKCELSAVIAEAIQMVMPAANAKGLVIETDLDRNAGPASCDPTRIRQVVWNLLVNAVKFTPREERSGSRTAVSAPGTASKSPTPAKGLHPTFFQSSLIDSVKRTPIAGASLGDWGWAFPSSKHWLRHMAARYGPRARVKDAEPRSWSNCPFAQSRWM
jgi:light-regulated signal transduction histidine kinase (bacteriophytochrome)